MRIGTKLMAGFLTIAVLTGVTSYFSARLSSQIWSLRRVELPMEQHLGQVEESLWQAVHAVDVFVASADPCCVEEYHHKAREVERAYGQYLALTDTSAERVIAAEFNRHWSTAKDAAENTMAAVGQCKRAEDRFFEYVDKADDVIDFQIQAHFSPSDPNVLAKEQSLREVEVSVWEAIHAAQQYTGLTPHISRGDHSQNTFAELMEKQFVDVEEFWPQYVALANTAKEREAIEAFESLWAKAVLAGRDVVKLHDEARRQFVVLNEGAKALDDVVDSKMVVLVENRVSAKDDSARRAKVIAVLVGVAAVLGAIVIGLVTTRSIAVPVARLKDATVELARGNLGYRIGSSKKNEFGLVSRAFDRMARQMHASTEALEGQIAQRTAAEESLQTTNAELTTAMAKLSRANDELREFVYIASHDLREPMRKISSFGSLLKESLWPGLSEDDRENLMFMVDGAGRMTEMIEGLLTYSRVNSSEKVREVIDLNDTIEELERLELGAIIEETGAAIDVPAPLPKVVGNPQQIRQLLQNLIANGIKYHREGVRPGITITAGGGDGDEVKVSVGDNGIGISEEHYENIFKMFRRLHNRRKYSGTGIGLAVCKRIMAKHGGQIGVVSREGEGTTFWFTLRRAAEAKAKEQGKEAVALA